MRNTNKKVILDKYDTISFPPIEELFSETKDDKFNNCIYDKKDININYKTGFLFLTLIFVRILFKMLFSTEE